MLLELLNLMALLQDYTAQRVGAALCDAVCGVRMPAGVGLSGWICDAASSSSRHYNWIGPCPPALGAEL